MEEFCRCGGRFDPGFGDADEIWMVGIDETRQSGRVRVSKDGTDVESMFVIYLASKNGLTMKTGLGFIQGHWKWQNLIDRLRV